MTFFNQIINTCLAYFQSFYQLTIQLIIQIYELLFPSTEKLINDQLDRWKVEMYSENTYLIKIPQKRIDEKRAEIERNFRKN